MNIITATPRIDVAAARAMQAVVMDGGNGVCPELRSIALRKMRASVRRGHLRPTSVRKALATGDAGIAKLFASRSDAKVPLIDAASLSVRGRTPIPASVLRECRWFIELALRKGVAPPGLIDCLGGGCDAASASEMLIQTWNALLASYKPDWLPEAAAAQAPQVLISPVALSLDREYHDLEGLDVVVEPLGISRLFVDTAADDFDLLQFALSRLDSLLKLPIFAADPNSGRASYTEYLAEEELMEDMERHVRLNANGSVNTVDREAISTLLESFGHDDPECAIDYYVERLVAIKNASAPRHALTQKEADRRIRGAKSDYAKVARSVLALCIKLDATPDAKGTDYRLQSLGLPVHLIASPEDDPLHEEISQLIDSECSEEIPRIAFKTSKKPSELDAQMRRIVVESLVADHVYGMVIAAIS